jgi:hypothetical protein
MHTPVILSGAKDRLHSGAAVGCASNPASPYPRPACARTADRQLATDH